MRKWFRRFAAACVIIAVLAGAWAWWAIRQTQQVPEFYRLATQRSDESVAAQDRVQAARRMNQNVQRLQDAAQQPGAWHATFSSEEINAWLAEELPKSFPHWLQRGLSEPRVAIEDGRMLAAARLKNRRIDTVVSCQVSVELTEQPNMLAIRLEDLRAGALSIPWGHFLDRISREAAVGDIDIQWDMTETGPVALLAIPGEHPEFAIRPVLVESIQLGQGQISLAGRSGESAKTDYRPKTSIHRFVSYQPDPNSRRQALLIPSEKSKSQIR
ncbi:hypothetical protein V7x_41260 [Crateriforma conspicua]|uniref:Uncharacterized protein n=1 Tax=Crateriforma conspicua TaxID=2527996 RepID=A0A5C6FPF7_9PLAN|nr:hypothetical protein [Crateriforma conspicua]TWU62396.1 hypothetical protein V7x_41260 [Crateriforma conspicua]